MRKLIFCCFLLLLAGCKTYDPAHFDVSAFRPTDGILRRAVVAGLTKVDKVQYVGWDGDCPGCDTDAEVFAMFCTEHGAQVAEFHNDNATSANLIEAARIAWKDMKAGDLFIFYVSGHGGQIPDLDGDEDDRMDETLCLWDGELSDDILYVIWNEIPPGVRVLYITDTCNSGSNFRYKPRNLEGTIPRDYMGSMIHIGGCADGKSSFGSAQGGKMTTALMDAWKEGSGMTYEQWFLAMALLMPKNQVPVFVEYGSPSFRTTLILQ